MSFDFQFTAEISSRSGFGRGACGSPSDQGPRDLSKKGPGIDSEGNHKVTGEPIRLSDGRFEVLFEPKQTLD